MKTHRLPDHEDALLIRHRLAKARRRLTLIVGVAMLLLGYASLAIQPDTPLDWVLLRVAVGFALLFIGFAVAVLPWLAHLFGDSDE